MFSGNVSVASTSSGAVIFVSSPGVMFMPVSGISNLRLNGKIFAIYPVMDTSPVAEKLSAEQ